MATSTPSDALSVLISPESSASQSASNSASHSESHSASVNLLAASTIDVESVDLSGSQQTSTSVDRAVPSASASLASPPPVLVHPWPQWKSIFEYVGILENAGASCKHDVLGFSCILCKKNGSRQAPLKTARSSRSNLKRHMDSRHGTDPAWLAAKAPAVSLASASALVSTFVSPTKPPLKKQRQTKIGDTFHHRKVVTQAIFDNALEELIILEMLPFHCVERGPYLQFFKSTSPDFTVMTRRTLMSRIKKKYTDLKSKLISCLEEADSVATTCDLWSCHGRSFIGVTAHWIDKNALERKSGVLACRRVKGKHTYDVVGSLLSSIHKEFKIHTKVSMTTTDNGSNMVKAFNFYKDVAPAPSLSVRCVREEDVYVVEEEEDDDDDADVGCIADNLTQVFQGSAQSAARGDVSLCHVYVVRSSASFKFMSC